MKKIITLICGLITLLSHAVLAQCDFGTGLVVGNSAPFASGSAAVTIVGNNVTVIANTTMTGGVYNFNDFTISSGVTVSVVAGNGPLIIRCTGTATINGIIDARGGNGGTGLTGFFSGGTGGAGGTGGGGWGAPGGQGGTTNANQNGINGNSFGTSNGAGLGGSGTFSSSPFAGAGGGGAGHSLNGANGSTNDGGAGGLGGLVYGDPALATFMIHNGINSNLLGGSGGGGGGHRGAITVHGGGGGGGGGGAVRITATTINFAASGVINVQGGNGGVSTDNSGAYGGSGGGGSGGTIHLQSSNISGFTAGVNSNVLGGNGGPTLGGSQNSAGGNGSAGRLLVEPCSLTNSITTGTITGAPFCAGAAISIPFTSTGTFNSGNTYTAQLSDASGSFASPVTLGTLNSTANTGTINGTIPGGTPTGAGYLIRVISSNPAITGSTFGPFTINAAVTATNSITANPAGAICAGTSVTFSSNITNGGASPGFQWQVNGSNVSGATASSFTSTTLANGDNVTLVLTSNAACVTNSPVTSNAISMTVNPNLPVSVSISSNPSGAICSGSAVNFTATPTNGGTTPAFQWSVNGSAVIGATASTFNSSTLGNNDVVTVTLQSTASCAAGSPATSNAITMQVNTTLTASVSISASSNPVCSGQAVTFTASPTNGGSAPSYQWTLNGTNVGTSATFTSSSLANNDIIGLTMTSNDPCVTVTTVNAQPLVITVVNNVTPSVNIVAATNPICAGNVTNFTATPDNGGSSPTYQWFVNGVAVSGATTSTFTPSALSNNDAVTVDLTSNANCASPVTVTLQCD
jgi:hypothetical protein